MDCIFPPFYIFLLFVGLIYARSTSIQMKCERPGMNPHPSDCHYFVLCVESATEGLKPVTVISCPPSQAFSKQHLACVNNTQVPECPLQERRRLHSDHKDYQDLLDVYVFSNSMESMGDKPVSELCYHGIGTNCHESIDAVVFCSVIGNKLTVFLAASCTKIDERYPSCCSGDKTCSDRTCSKYNGHYWNGDDWQHSFSLEDNDDSDDNGNKDWHGNNGNGNNGNGNNGNGNNGNGNNGNGNNGNGNNGNGNNGNGNNGNGNNWNGNGGGRRTTTRRPTTTIKLTTTTAKATTTTKPTATKPTTTKPITKYPIICTSQKLLIPDPESLDCTRYYQCNNDANGDLFPVQKRCDDLMRYDPTLGHCVDQHQVPCPYPTTTTPKPTTPFPVTCLKAKTFIADPKSKNCTSFYECKIVNGVLTPVLNECKFPYMRFHPDLGYCVNEYYVPCK